MEMANQSIRNNIISAHPSFAKKKDTPSEIATTGENPQRGSKYSHSETGTSVISPPNKMDGTNTNGDAGNSRGSSLQRIF